MEKLTQLNFVATVPRISESMGIPLFSDHAHAAETAALLEHLTGDRCAVLRTVHKYYRIVRIDRSGKEVCQI